MTKQEHINSIIKKFSAEIGQELKSLKFWETEHVTAIISTRIKLGLRQLSELAAISFLEKINSLTREIQHPSTNKDKKITLEKKLKELKVEAKLASRFLSIVEDEQEYYEFKQYLKEKGLGHLIKEFSESKPNGVPLKEREIKEITVINS